MRKFFLEGEVTLDNIKVIKHSVKLEHFVQNLVSWK